MILLVALAAGFLLGYLRSRLAHRPYRPPTIQYYGLLLVGILPQWLAFQFPATREAISDQLASLALIASLALLLLFILLNRKVPGFMAVGLGLALNLLVILTNGGWMPASPEIIAQIYPQPPPEAWQAGERIGWSKDILLPRSETRLWFLSDAILTPAGLPFRFALSLGDVLIAIGVIWLLWEAAGPQKTDTNKDRVPVPIQQKD